MAGDHLQRSIRAQQSRVDAGFLCPPIPKLLQLIEAPVVVGIAPLPLSAFDTRQMVVRELQGFVKNQIAPYKYPRQVAFLEALPRTETGKVQRFKLREQRGS